MTGWIEPPPPQRRGTGCVGKGCLILCCLLLFLMIAGAVGIYLGMRKHSAIVHAAVWAKKTHLLADEPAPVPQFETTQENIAATKQKWSNFRNATPNDVAVENPPTADVPRDTRAGQVELTADDLNNLIAANRPSFCSLAMVVRGCASPMALSPTATPMRRVPKSNARMVPRTSAEDAAVATTRHACPTASDNLEKSMPSSFMAAGRRVSAGSAKSTSLSAATVSHAFWPISCSS